MRRRISRKGERGQAATEYMLVISIIVIAIVVAASPLYPLLTDGMEEFRDDYEEFYAKPDERTPQEP